MLIVTYVVESNKNKAVSNKFNLYVTPPGVFFSIWIFIFISTGITSALNSYKNTWTSKAHLSFISSNISSILWSFTFNTGNLTWVCIAAIFLLSISLSLLALWY